MSRLRLPFDVADIFAVLGLLLLGYGLTLVWEPLAPIVVGTLLIAYAVLVSRTTTVEVI